MAKKIKQVNGCIVAELSTRERADFNDTERFAVYTRDEWEQPVGMRYPEMTTDNVDVAIDFAKSF